MNALHSLVDLFLHLDVHLLAVIQQYGMLTYVILFLILFIETGIVILPFLPGDSLLFAAGAFAAKGVLNPVLLFTVMSAAAILGDSLNYAIGKFLGPRVFRENMPLLNKEHLRHAERFYEKYGSKTIVLARFVPIIRTVAPFVAGIGNMQYARFLGYNIAGGLLWVALFVFGGFFFGNIPVVKDHFELVIIGIVVVSVLPGIVHYARYKMKKNKKAEGLSNR